MKSKTQQKSSVLTCLLLLAVFPASCLNQCGQAVQPKIIHGTSVQRGTFPWMASLVAANNPAYIDCGGALITRRYVVTALHCTKRDPHKLRILLGTTDLRSIDSDSYIAKIEKFIHYEGEGSKKDIDIALVKLKNSVRLSQFIQPICLPLPDLNFADVQAVVIGFGETNPAYERTGVSEFSDTLLEGVVNVTSTENCNKIMARYGRPIDSKLLCAGSYLNQPDHCYGDSGGPLMWLNRNSSRWELIGVVSSAYQCANMHDYSFYVNVTHFSNWITEHSDYKSV